MSQVTAMRRVGRFVTGLGALSVREGDQVAAGAPIGTDAD